MTSTEKVGWVLALAVLCAVMSPGAVSCKEMWRTSVEPSERWNYEAGLFGLKIAGEFQDIDHSEAGMNGVGLYLRGPDYFKLEEFIRPEQEAHWKPWWQLSFFQADGSVDSPTEPEYDLDMSVMALHLGTNVIRPRRRMYIPLGVGVYWVHSKVESPTPSTKRDWQIGGFLGFGYKFGRGKVVAELQRHFLDEDQYTAISVGYRW